MSVLDPQVQVPDVMRNRVLENAQQVQNFPTLTQEAEPVTTPTPVVPVISELERRALIEEASQLSSGVYVKFTRINRSISTDLTIKTFNNVNLDKKGNILTDNLSTKEQMNMAQSISDYHSVLIQQGVELFGKVDDYTEMLGLPDNWAKRLRNLATGYDIDDPDDVTFLFLRYYAFQNEDDWALLSQKTLNA